jgi:hypothetical protein
MPGGLDQDSCEGNDEHYHGHENGHGGPPEFG